MKIRLTACTGDRQYAVPQRATLIEGDGTLSSNHASVSHDKKTDGLSEAFPAAVDSTAHSVRRSRLVWLAWVVQNRLAKGVLILCEMKCAIHVARTVSEHLDQGACDGRVVRLRLLGIY